MPLVHQHLIVRAEVNRAPTDTTFISNWLRNLAENLGMKIMMGPIAGYSPVEGNRGLTAAAVIETSHIVIHCWDECAPNMLQLDVYSCAPVDRDIVMQAIESFEPVHVDYKFLDREQKFIAML